MSFREFVYLETGILFEKITFPYETIDNFSTKVIKQIDVLHYFRQYCEKGTRSFYKEPEFQEKLLRVLEKVLYYDLPTLLGNVSENHFSVMKAMVSHLLHSKIPTVDIESLSNEWGGGRTKTYEILKTLAEIELLNIVYKKGKEEPFSKDEKIFFSDPIFYKASDGKLGNFRKGFALKEIGKVWACDNKNKEEGDFIFENFKLEVGGRQKN